MQRNIVFLVDSSRSMNIKTGKESHFKKAIQAIEKVFACPDSALSDVYVSVVFFWDDLFKGFRTEPVYQWVPLNSAIDPKKLVEFGEPPSLAGTSLDQGLNYAIKFLEGKQGEKIIKLVTDSAVNAQKTRDKNKFTLLEKEIRFDCIAITQRRNSFSQEVIGVSRLGQTFEESEVDAIAKDLLFP